MALILGVILLSLIFLQTAKQESLGNAFSNLRQSKFEKVTMILTFFTFFILATYLIIR